MQLKWLRTRMKQAAPQALVVRMNEPRARATRVVLRPIANPLPLGFLALAGGDAAGQRPPARDGSPGRRPRRRA